MRIRQELPKPIVYKLNPDLLSKDLFHVMQRAAQLSYDFKGEALIPETIMVYLLSDRNCAANRILRALQKRLPKLNINLLIDQYLQLARMVQTDVTPTDLYFEYSYGKFIKLSKECIILLDEALSIANSHQYEVHIDTDHVLMAILKHKFTGFGVFEQMGLTLKFLTEFIDLEARYVY